MSEQLERNRAALEKSLLAFESSYLFFLKNEITRELRKRDEEGGPSKADPAAAPVIVPIYMHEAEATEAYARKIMLGLQQLTQHRGRITRTKWWVEETWEDGSSRLWRRLCFQVGWDNGDVYQFGFAPATLNTDLKLVVWPERYFLDLVPMSQQVHIEEGITNPTIKIRHEAPEAKPGGDAE